MAKTRVVVVGASHGGHQTVLELLHRYQDLDITMYEAGSFVSFMSCGMELYLEDRVTDVNDVRNFRPEDLTSRGAKVLNEHTVTAINADAHTVEVQDASGATQTVPYDKLVLSSGVAPKQLPVAGRDLDNIYLMRGYDWATKIKAKLEDANVKNVTVVGAGYIGVEAAEAAQKAGKNVTLIDVLDRPLGLYLDEAMTTTVKAELEAHGVKVLTPASIKAYTGNGAVSAVATDQGDIATDLVIEAAGVAPATDWLKGTVDLDDRGFIKTDEYLQTNVPDVYAIGDATLVYSIAARKHVPIALATVARREARYLVKHLFEANPSAPFKGVVGASALSVFDLQFASAGLTTATAKNAGVSMLTSDYTDSLRPAYVPESDGNPQVAVSLGYDPQTHRLLGGAVLGDTAVTAQGNVIALAIAHEMTLEDLADADFFFQPGFDRQWSLLNLAAQHALNEPRF